MEQPQPVGTIVPLVECDFRARQAIEDIFFLSSSVQDFENPALRADFCRRWTSYYLSHELDQVRLHRLADGTITGYLMGCPNSRGAKPLFRDIGSYRLFDSCFDRYPAHFHVSCHPTHRGRGIGSALVRAFLDDCRAASLPGAHVVTALGARNVAFYEHLGFGPLDARDFEGIRRLLLGLRLD